MKITESQLRRIIREEARRISEGPLEDFRFSGSQYELYSDELDAEIDAILESLDEAVVSARAQLQGLLNSPRAQSLGSSDPDVQHAVWDAFALASQGKKVR